MKEDTNLAVSYGKRLPSEEAVHGNLANTSDQRTSRMPSSPSLEASCPDSEIRGGIGCEVGELES